MARRAGSGFIRRVSRPTSGLRLLALGATLASWGLVAVGGVVRASESGLGCPDWPLCDGRVVPVGQKEPLIEFSHRAVAATAVVLVVWLTVWALRRHRADRDLVVPLVLATALIPAQALLGAVVVWLELPGWIVGVHFMVGMVFLGAVVVAAAAAWRGPGLPASSWVRVSWLAAAGGLALVTLGAAVVAADADHACGEQWPGCNGGFATGGGLAWLQVAHRTAAYVVLGLALALALLGLAGRGPLLLSLLPAALGAAQLGIGIGMVLVAHGSDAHLVLRALHVGGAGAVWASVVAAVAHAAVAPRSAATRGQPVLSAVGVPARAR